MFFDWIGREGGALLSWWLLIMFAAVAVFPLLFRLMRGLPSRGYALAPAAGLLLVGFIFWILNILGLLRNTPGSTILAWLIVVAISGISYATWREREPILPWLREHLTLIVVSELLFAGLFVGWATVRALNPNLGGTEHPMDMAFLSAIRRSATFPPNDPWMSGYAISYYHFGYILMAMVANMSGVINGIAFNLAISLVFALAGSGVFSVVYDLVALRTDATGKRAHTAIATGLIGVMFLLFLGNLGTAAVEVPYQTKALSAGSGYLSLLDLKYRPADLSGCSQSGSIDPATWNCGGWWWWGYSRVVQDRDLNGSAHEIIDEVPQFSFILSDLHPHVMALPFVLLTLGLALNLVAGKRRLHAWEVLLYGIFAGALVFLNTWDAVFIVFLIGAEALRRLLNNGTGRFTREDWFGIAVYGAAFLGLTVILYLPFFIGFRSQANGILPDVIWPTQFPQYFLFFGIFIVILGGFLIAELRRGRDNLNWRLSREVTLTAAAFLVLATIVFGFVASRANQGIVAGVLDQTGGVLGVLPQILARRLQGVPTEGLLLLGLALILARLFPLEPIRSDGTPGEARQIITYSRATGFALLLIAAGAVLTLLPDFVYLADYFGDRINMIFKTYYQGWALWSIASAYALWSVLSEVRFKRIERVAEALSVAIVVFAVLNVAAIALEYLGIPIQLRLALIIIEIGLIIARLYILFRFPRSSNNGKPGGLELAARLGFGVVASLFITAGMAFPVAAIYSRAFAEGGHLNGANNPLTLDGGPSLADNADEYAVIQCFARNATSDNAIVAEATRVGLAYNSQFGRVSGLTGIPTLLGWDNHENQWRGKTFEDANIFHSPDGTTETRPEAIAHLYDTTDWSVVQSVVKRYGITFIYVGPTERFQQVDGKSLFDAAGIAKFATLKPFAGCQQGDAAVYSVDSIATQQISAGG